MDPLLSYHNTPSFIDLNEDQPQDDDDDHLFRNLMAPHISPSQTLSYSQQDQAQFFFREEQSFQLHASLEVDHKIVSSGGSCDHHHHHPKADQESESDYNNLKLRIWKSTSDNNTLDDSVKWTSSKMRMMRKMIITNTDHNHHQDHDHHQSNTDDHRHNGQIMNNFTSSTSSSSNINNNGVVIVRVCSDCNTTKTPLWRSGPRGPKSLCNACGIRQRKARRAMAAAAANGTGVAAADDKKAEPKIQPKVKKSKISIAGEGSFGNKKPQFKKRSTAAGPSSRGRKKLVCFEDILRISMKKSSAFHHVFPQDEKDAAILLMALSYGLVHG